MSEKETKGDQLAAPEPTRQLPTITDLYERDDLAKYHAAAQFQVLVNQPPKKEWLKEHPTAKKEVVIDGVKQKVPTVYLPIERVEWLLVNVIVRYKTEVREVKQIANSVEVTVRLHYWDPVYAEWTFHDGIGAAPLQTNSGQNATDWTQIKSNSVQIGAPAAKSYAIKDAAENIGKLFGKDLNRKENISFDNIADKYEKALSND